MFGILVIYLTSIETAYYTNYFTDVQAVNYTCSSFGVAIVFCVNYCSPTGSILRDGITDEHFFSVIEQN